jgi:hypothetical protein
MNEHVDVDEHRLVVDGVPIGDGQNGERGAGVGDGVVVVIGIVLQNTVHCCVLAVYDIVHCAVVVALAHV